MIIINFFNQDTRWSTFILSYYKSVPFFFQFFFLKKLHLYVYIYIFFIKIYTYRYLNDANMILNRICQKF